MPRVVIAPDKFKGTLGSQEVADALARGMQSVRGDLDIVTIPVADGGDGTLAAVEQAGFAPVPVDATDAIGRPARTQYMRRGDEAVVEMAAICGLAMLGEQLDPMGASSFGLGTVIRSALDAGCRRIVVGIGGSASTDGGAGMMQALGAQLLRADGSEVAPGGGGLGDAAVLRLAGLQPALASAQLLFACDVDNPLTGRLGAAHVYGPQKGASAEQVLELDAALAYWADLVADATGRDLRDVAGAGAAGGVGFAAVALLGAALQPGARLVFDLVDLPEALAGADLVVTGEGALDEQTLHGKAPAAVAELAAAQGIPVVGVCGINLLEDAGVARLGARSVHAVMDIASDREEAMTRPLPLLEQIGAQLAGGL